MDKDGGAVFPTLHPSEHMRYQGVGMSLRDYFAAHALAGLMANDDAMQRVINTAQGRQPVHAPDGFKIAAFCWNIADEMLSERKS